MNLIDELYTVVDCLERARIDYAICGSIAVIIHGYPRLTKDFDIMILSEDKEKVRKSMKEIGYDISSGIIPYDNFLSFSIFIFSVATETKFNYADSGFPDQSIACDATE
ncbi:MAG: hypothetical protein A2161_07735 [Candidatus Schekmanbacteria bacterium RBG_13_48_7]|uniref:Uncharacterized protein n=1 Tax=Candidatus Schekmanbacteria bacterium RBG_13_48_7 TaxID=1817878 RepID=A0A1F7RXV0_9BACT|nr:MAG: hypothetical protein A2161_07735 [Candidatus Schekmanbacteria bacterium RBG_13_48_7]